MPSGHRARCFGLDWQSDIALRYFDPVAGDDAPVDIRVQRTAHPAERPLTAIAPRAAAAADGFRFHWDDDTLFDGWMGERIDYRPGTGWSGRLPECFYSSVAAMTLAFRGLLPLHASSVVIDGRAWLIAGLAGAGKSVQAAELVGAGGRLLADDLSVLVPGAESADPGAVRGRPAMRLHPDSAARLDLSRSRAVPDDPRGKLLAWPTARAADCIWPIGGLIVLANRAPGRLLAREALAAWGAILFRPRIMAALPGAAARRVAFFAIAQRLPVWRLPPAEGFSPDARRARLDGLMNAIGAMARNDSR